MTVNSLPLLIVVAALGAAVSAYPNPSGPPLEGTKPLTLSGDIASQLVAGVDRFLLLELERSTADREPFWRRDFSSPEAYTRSVAPQRERLAHILGVRDPRSALPELQLLATTAQPALIGQGHGFEVLAVRWPAFADVHGEGLLLRPVGRPPLADVIALPDADQTPEQITGLADGVPLESQFARRLAESGCRVLVPVLIDRHLESRNGRATLTSREYLYRPAFELGRHIIGYEVQKVLAAIDSLTLHHPLDTPTSTLRPGSIGVIGWGEGGGIALYAAALDPRIDAVCVSGYFDDRNDVWQQPIDRNVFGLLEQFGDAELAAMIAPRTVVIEAARGPELTLPGKGGAPARLSTPELETVRREVARARQLLSSLPTPPPLDLVTSHKGDGPYGSAEALQRFLTGLVPGAILASNGRPPEPLAPAPDPRQRMARQIHELDRHNQALLVESPYVRKEFMSRLNTSSLADYAESVEDYRTFFRDEVIGHFNRPLAPFNPRSRLAYDHELWTGYEVVLDVFPDVIAYGILLLPKDLAPGERRPVVVCQHGLEGRPQELITGNHRAYHDYAARLAERGFITFAPQNLYLFGDRFRTLQRKANPLKKTLFSIIVPQHQQIVNWLKSLPGVDPDRIAFYGLSYGGKTAMRVPPLVSDYALSICSADFNEWVWKNASTRSPYSYVWTGEYEIFEFDLGSTFNYAEMTALIAPRPFMVERGHFDGVAPDEAVAYEFAKVRFLYQAQLGIGDRCEIEWFAGPHTIHGQGSFDFLHRHLNWPQ